MTICPKVLTIRRKKKTEGDIETDRLSLNSTYDCIASINNIVINFDESVSIMYFAFHTINNAYCTEYKLLEADKRVCDNKNLNYVHFYFSLGGYSASESEYLVAFLPRFTICSDLFIFSYVLCSVAEWLGIKQINCVVFRHGKPVHGMDDSTHLQKQLDKAIKETKEFSILHKMVGRIRDIPTSLKEKNLTISKNIALANINVS
jgi:hypothetical protein